MARALHEGFALSRRLHGQERRRLRKGSARLGQPSQACHGEGGSVRIPYPARSGVFRGAAPWRVRCTVFRGRPPARAPGRSTMTRTKIVIGLSLTTSALAVFAERDAAACGGCFHPPTQTASDITDERMLLAASTTQSTLYDQIRVLRQPDVLRVGVADSRNGGRGSERGRPLRFVRALTATQIVPPVPNCPPPPNCGGGSSSGGAGFAATQAARMPPPSR